MQYVFFEKGICRVQWGLEGGEFSRICVLKVTLQTVMLLITVSYRKIGAAVCTSCSADNFVGGATASPVPTPVRPLIHLKQTLLKVLLLCLNFLQSKYVTKYCG